MLIDGEHIYVVDDEIVTDMCLPILPHNWNLYIELYIMQQIVTLLQHHLKAI